MKITRTGLLILGLISSCTYGATVYSDASAFNAHLGSSFTDNYESPNYQQLMSDAQMTAVYNETRYITTSQTWDEVFYLNAAASQVYCAGCNGTFILDFAGTNYGNRDGVFGVGFNLIANEAEYDTTSSSEKLDAFVTFGNGATEDFVLSEDRFETQFWGITDTRGVESIYFGIDRQPSDQVLFVIDNLTIGSAVATPEPTSVSLLCLGLAAAGIVGYRSRRTVQPCGPAIAHDLVQ